jgi:hypothetical protein
MSNAAARLHADEPPQLTPEQVAAINFAYGGQLDYRYADHCRAGFAQSVRAHTLPSNTRAYGGYYVGGGAPWFGEGRRGDEGTFGWDYAGLYFNRAVALNWLHGRREQGNGGTYETDGPKREHK